MKTTRISAIALMVVVAWTTGTRVRGQVVINEVVEDEQDFESTDVPDNREFIELYNAGSTAANIGNYTMHYYLPGTSATAPGSYFPTHDTIPLGTMLAPHAYYVLGADSVPNVTQKLGANIDLFPNANTIYELRTGPNTTDSLIDALAIDTFRDPELHNATQEQLDQVAFGKTAGPTTRGGWWGQVESNDAHPTDASYPNLPMSIGRYKDGLDHNINGRDFGMVPATPGATNNLPQVTVHSVPNVNSTPVDTVLRTDYYASFKLPRVIDPAVATIYNPKAITPSPQGGRAIVAWDETGGGNADYSKSYANEFKIYAYIDPTPLATTVADSSQNESTIYGIAGTTDLFFGTPNSAGLLTTTSSSNGSTGLGWLIQRRTNTVAGTPSTASVLQLIDFQSGGDSATTPSDWSVKQTIDITSLAAGWHVLGVKYDPVTGAVIGTYDSQTFNFTTTTDLTGNFYIGYRESSAQANSPNLLRPPTYDLYVAPAGVLGDYNGNGVVDMADYVLWRNGGPLQNDNTPGTVDASDYTFWRSRFGQTTGSGVGQSSAVPEPCMLALTMIGVSCIGCMRRRLT